MGPSVSTGCVVPFTWWYFVGAHAHHYAYHFGSLDDGSVDYHYDLGFHLEETKTFGQASGSSHGLPSRGRHLSYGGYV